MNIKRNVRALCAFGVSLGLLVSCFSERSPTGTIDENLCEGAAPAGVVRIKDISFQPAQLQVSAGTEVRWVNCDDVGHTSTSDSPSWDSPLLSRGQVFSRTFTQAGRFAYHCEPHPFMAGEIVVQ